MYSDDYGQKNLELMAEFNRRFIAGDESAWVPEGAIIMFLPSDPDHRAHNLKLGLKLIEEGNDVFFKRLDVIQDSELTSRAS